MNNTKKLLYRPNLQPERDYRSDAILSDITPALDSQTINETPAEETLDRVAQIIQDIKEIKEIAKYLPGDLPMILNGPLEPLLEQVQTMFPTGSSEGMLDVSIADVYEPENNDNNDEPLPDISVVEITDDYIEIDAELPDLLPQSTDIQITVITPKSLANISSNTYMQDSIDLKEDYLTKLQTVAQKYLQEMIMVMTEAGVSDIEQLTRPYDGDAVIVPNVNLKHLSDYIVRSQIAREQKTRLFKKTHNVDQTMMHMRLWHAAEKQRERYYEETYGDSETYLNTQSNSLLRESRAIYDKKYNQSLYDMYKYLNASVIIISDTLQMSLKESQAKGVLLKNGVNIYATKESLEMAQEEAAAATQKPADGSNSEQTTKAAQTPAATDATNSNKATSDLSKTSTATQKQSAKDKAISMLKTATNDIKKNVTNDIKKEAQTALKDFGKRLFK